MASYKHQSNGNGIPPKITLYTNHACPWAHRAHIALKELDLTYEEIIIDLDTPREAWYLEVNPRGLVPSIKISNGILEDEIITESAVVAQFLCDLRPSHLLPGSLESPTAPLTRARVNFFVDTYSTKIAPFMYTVMMMATMKEKEVKSKEWSDAIAKELEPLLKDAAPFFGNSKELTLAEVQVAPFIIRMYAMCNGELLPKSLKDSLNKLPNFSKWAQATIAKESVTYVFDEADIIKRTADRIEKMKAQAK